VNRAEKEKQVAWLREEFLSAKAVFLANYQGLSVAEMNALRSELRAKGVKLKVIKNTLVRLASKDLDVALLDADLEGPRAAAWTGTADNVPAMAKVLNDFAKTHPQLALVRGTLRGKLLEPQDMEALSTLPPREVLLGRLLGTMMAPISAFVNTLAAIPRSFLNVLKAIEEKKQAAAGPAESAT
jgi:large subunit ribosomal protein L10